MLDRTMKIWIGVIAISLVTIFMIGVFKSGLDSSDAAPVSNSSDAQSSPSISGVQIGMTVDQVEQLWGSPSYISETDINAQGTRQYRTYSQGTIFYHNGVVDQIQSP